MESTNESLCCPITGDVMVDPYIYPDGYTYDKEAIQTWLRQHSVSPFTRQRMAVGDGMPNRAIKTMIDELHASPNAVVP
jgi:hypothetical protein